MNDYKMTPERCKLLTEMIGECWHDYEPIGDSGWSICTKCCWKVISNLALNHTFTTPDDMHKVFTWLVDKGYHHDIYMYAESIYQKEVSRTVWVAEIFAWLFYDAERFCCIVAIAKEGVI